MIFMYCHFTFPSFSKKINRLEVPFKSGNTKKILIDVSKMVTKFLKMITSLTRFVMVPIQKNAKKPCSPCNVGASMGLSSQPQLDVSFVPWHLTVALVFWGGYKFSNPNKEKTYLNHLCTLSLGHRRSHKKFLPQYWWQWTWPSMHSGSYCCTYGCSLYPATMLAGWFVCFWGWKSGCSASCTCNYVVMSMVKWEKILVKYISLKIVCCYLDNLIECVTLRFMWILTIVKTVHAMVDIDFLVIGKKQEEGKNILKNLNAFYYMIRLFSGLGVLK